MRCLTSIMLVAFLFSPALAGARFMEAHADTTVVAPGPPTVPVVPVAPGIVVSTTAPVTSDTSISVGTFAGEILKYIAALFVATLGTVGTFWVKRMFDLAGMKMTEAQSAELNATLVRGANWAADSGAAAMQGRGKIEVKDAIVRGAIDYTIQHKDDLLKQMGADSADGKTIVALKARLATLAADPTVPTPPILDPVKPATAGV